MLSSMSNGVITINSEEEIVKCNKSGLKILRTKGLEIIKKQSKDFFLAIKNGYMTKLKVLVIQKNQKLLLMQK